MSRHETRYRAVIFDLDNTLYPHKAYIDSGFRAVSKYINRIHGIPVRTPSTDNINPSREEELLAQLLSENFKHTQESFLNRVVKVYHSHQPSISLFTDAAICLPLLKNYDIRIGLVIQGEASVQKRKVDALNLQHLVDSVIYPSYLHGDSTFEEALKLAELESEIPLSSSIYVGHGAMPYFKYASALGMRTVRIQRSVCRYPEIDCRGFQPDFTVESLDILPTLLDADSGDDL